MKLKYKYMIAFEMYKISIRINTLIESSAPPSVQKIFG